MTTFVTGVQQRRKDTNWPAHKHRDIQSNRMLWVEPQKIMVYLHTPPEHKTDEKEWVELVAFEGR